MRDRRLELAGAAMILVAGGIVWLLHNPASSILDRAARWPVVGSAARAIIERFRPPPASETPRVEEPIVEYHYRIGGSGVPSGNPSSGGSPGRPAETEIRRFASFDAVEPVGPLLAMEADPRRLEGALARLSDDATQHRLGRYEVWSDHPGIVAILGRWRPLVADSERAWTERYGVAPLGSAAETVVLFASGEAFAAFARDSGVLASEANGFSSRGVVALAAEGRLPEELDASFQHELAHLLARRSIGPALPPWLAEGLAEDFGESPLGGDGRFDFDRVRGVVRRQDHRFDVRGGLAVLDLSGRRAARGAVPDLRLHVTDGDDPAEDSGAAASLYADAFVWIRFLLSEPSTASGVRDFLAAVRGGGEPTLAALEEHMGRSLAGLAPELSTWLLALRGRELAAHGAPSRLPDAEGVVAIGPRESEPES